MSVATALRQTATYWAPTGTTDRYGKPALSTPQQIACRWEDRQSQIISKTGENTISKSRVYTQVGVDIDGYLALGDLSDIDPRSLDDAFEVQQVSTTPDLRGLQALVTVYL